MRKGKSKDCSPLPKVQNPYKQRALDFFNKKHGQNNGQKNSIFVPYMDFKPARLYPLKGKLNQDWYVYFEIFNEGLEKFESFKIRVNINRIKKLQDKKIYGQNLIAACDDLLRKGINPLELKHIPVDPVADPGEQIRNLPIIEGLKWAREKHEPTVEPSTRREYVSVFNYLLPAIKEVGFSNITVGGFKKGHLRTIMEHLRLHRKGKRKVGPLSDKRYNSYLETIQGLFKEFVRYDVFEISPIANFEKLRESEAISYETLTSREKKIIYEHLAKVNPDFLTYYLLMYHTAMRPKTLVSVQIFNLNMEQEVFIIKPTEKVTLQGQEHQKVKSQRKTLLIPIPPEAMELLRAMNLEQYPKDYFIFSTEFKPGHVNIDRKRATEAWHREVITGLGINKKMYGGKHTGADDKLDAGISLDAISSQAGHTDTKMTKRYTSRLKVIQGDEIKKKSKRFLDGSKEN